MRAVVVAVAVVMASGAFTASAVAGHGESWSGHSGATEPSTRWDTSQVMWPGPNQAAEDKLYLNGFVMSDALNRYDVQLQGGSVMPVTIARFAAALGIWRDCNRDGYIGFRGAPASFGSFSVYPRALSPPDESICPPGSPFNPTNTATNSPNGLIDEFRWVGPNATGPQGTPPSQVCVPPSGNPVRICAPVGADTRVTTDFYDFIDPGARAWVDWGYPGSMHLIEQSITVDYSNSKDSDSTLAYLDSALQYRLSGSLGPTWTAKPNLGACGEPPQFLGGSGGTCGAYPLYQATRLVNDSRQDGRRASPLVQTFEIDSNDGGSTSSPCDDGFDQTIAGRRVAMPNLQPRVHPNFLVEGSVMGSADNVWRGTDNATFSGRCAKPGIPVGSGGDASEDDEVHRRVSDELRFVPDQRYHALDAFGFQSAPLDLAGVRGSPASPTGVPVWNGERSWTMRPPRTGGGLAANMYATFYADTTTVPASALPIGAQDKFTYGTDYCPAIVTGASNVNAANLWECSTTEWEAKRIRDNDPARPILGYKFDVRDVDCMDNSVTDLTPVVTVRAGLADCSADVHQ